MQHYTSVLNIVHFGYQRIPLCSLDGSLLSIRIVLRQWRWHALKNIPWKRRHLLRTVGDLVPGCCPKGTCTPSKRAMCKGLSVRSSDQIFSLVECLLGKRLFCFWCGKEKPQNFWKISNIRFYSIRAKENSVLKQKRQLLCEYHLEMCTFCCRLWSRRRPLLRLSLNSMS